MLAVLLAGSAPALPAPPPSDLVEVVVTLPEPPLAEAVTADRALAAHAVREHRLDVRTPASTTYLRTLASAQRSLEARIGELVPSARVTWHYGVVADGMAVVVPRSKLSRLRRVAGAAHVYPSFTYHSLLDRSTVLIGAPTIWGPTLQSAGQGVKIAIIDDGIDPHHPFFNPAAFTMPPGYPLGNKAYTSAKIIVARAFPPPASPSVPRSPAASLPFDPGASDHAMHVAGIAAGDHDVVANAAGISTAVLSGVAPDAYLGNYKVLTTPTAGGVGLDGNSPEIVAGIEAAVRDGMDVINLSIGEPEIPLSEDIVVQALDGAAAAGVVPVVAAGNDYDTLGNGTVSSPATAPAAITVAAVTNRRGTAVPDVIASFSSGGPTGLSLQLKPDVSAPGVGILSSFPTSEGSWAILEGTSMAAPHVAGAAALLRQRHPAWTVAQIKSALVLTGDPVYSDSGHTLETATTREGGGLVDLPHADTPLVFASPTNVAFGLMQPGKTAAQTIALTDAGGGAGLWSAVVSPQGNPAGVTVSVTPTIAVPGSLTVSANVAVTAPEEDATGFVLLSNGTVTRRIPYWLRVEKPMLPLDPTTPLTRPGVYSGNTSGRAANVTSYRYPDDPEPLDVAASLPGPEQVFRVTLKRKAANLGVAVLSEAPGVHIAPRIVMNSDENRLGGYAALPIVLNPYTSQFEAAKPVVAVIAPLPGTYDIVFDTTAAQYAGKFTFRFWIDDTTPPTATLASPSVTRSQAVRVRVVDSGSGVDPDSLRVKVDGKAAAFRYSATSGIVAVTGGSRSAGKHTIVVTASDYQEAKNMENVGPILPNTTTLRTSFVAR
jgi:subtilisin family serine protease